MQFRTQLALRFVYCLWSGNRQLRYVDSTVSVHTSTLSAIQTSLLKAAATKAWRWSDHNFAQWHLARGNIRNLRNFSPRDPTYKLYVGSRGENVSWHVESISFSSQRGCDWETKMSQHVHATLQYRGRVQSLLSVDNYTITPAKQENEFALV